MHRKNHSKYPISSHIHTIEIPLAEYNAMLDELKRLRNENAELKKSHDRENHTP